MIHATRSPRDRLRYVRRNGPYTLVMNAGGLYRLPFGYLPRLLMAWISTEAVRTQSRVLVLGDSLSDFMRELGIYSNSGRVHTRLRNQMKRLFGCTVTMVYEEPGGFARVSSFVADKHEFWWNERKPNESSLWESKIYLWERQPMTKSSPEWGQIATLQYTAPGYPFNRTHPGLQFSRGGSLEGDPGSAGARAPRAAWATPPGAAWWR